MAEPKTKKTKASVADFLASIEDEATRKDCSTIARMMRKATGRNAAMWGPSIVGFGDYSYEYGSGRTGEWFVMGFSPRKQNLTLYLMCGFDHDKALAASLGKYKLGRSCLYIRSLTDVDRDVLQSILDSGVPKVAAMSRRKE